MFERQTEPFPRGKLGSYFYATPALRLRMELVRDYIESGETPILIAGEAGAGKSTFLNQLMSRADHGWRVLRIPPVPSFSPSDIMTFLNAELRLSVGASSEDMSREFECWLERIAVNGQIAIVTVDDAHDLSDESLQHLARLPESVLSDNCRVLMTGLPGLRDYLTGLLGRSSTPAQSIDIPRLGRGEIARYIEMKMYHAGIENLKPFGRAAIGDIARYSGGNPGSIDAIASELLSGDQKRFQWRRASQRLWRLMRALTASGDDCHQK